MVWARRVCVEDIQYMYYHSSYTSIPQHMGLPRSLYAATTIHWDINTCQEVRLWTAEEGTRIADIFRCRAAA